MAMKSTGAAAKSARQAKLSVVRDDEQTEQQTTAPTNAQVTEQITEQTSAQVTAALAEMQAARRQLTEQIKAAKANQPPKPEKQPKPTKTLDDVRAAQLARPRTDVPRIICTYVLQRQAAGQDLYQALDEVLAQMKSIVLGSLDSRQPGETYHQAIFRYLGRTDMMSQPSDDTADEQ